MLALAGLGSALVRHPARVFEAVVGVVVAAAREKPRRERVQRVLIAAAKCGVVEPP